MAVEGLVVEDELPPVGRMVTYTFVIVGIGELGLVHAVEHTQRHTHRIQYIKRH